MRKRAAVVAAGMGMVLAGCGGGEDDNGVADLTGEEILAEAQSAIDEAESARITGSGTIEGQELNLDLTLGADSGAGTFGIGGVAFEATHVDGDFYLYGDAATWENAGGGPFASQVADQYVLVPSGTPGFSDLARLTALGPMTDELLVADGEVTKGEETEIGGQPVIGVADVDGSMLYIATTGEPLPVQITAPEGEDGTMDFEWDVEVDVTAPDEADVVDLTEVMNQ